MRGSYPFFLKKNTPTPDTSTLSLHDALPICRAHVRDAGQLGVGQLGARQPAPRGAGCRDRKSTRLNSSHTVISYAVFCLKKKNGQEPSACGAKTQPPSSPRQPAGTLDAGQLG